MKAQKHNVIVPDALQGLFTVLQQRGYDLIGPTIRDNAVVYGEIRSVDDLPVGWGDEQDAGAYRPVKRGDAAVFGYNLGPHSWKRFLFPPAMKLFSTTRSPSGAFVVDGQGNGSGMVGGKAEEHHSKPLAFIGVRACELNAILVQDKVFTGNTYTDPQYTDVRNRIFIVAVNCSQSAATCFCSSMSTGPRADDGFDLCLTEVLKNDNHYFLIEAGTKLGEEILTEIPRREAEETEVEEARGIVERVAGSMKRKMETSDIKKLLQQHLEHPRWDVVANRCLSCANCTMVCPTCFCHTVEDTTDLAGQHAARWRKWDSCFTTEFSYIHGGSIRTSPRSRYRQWLTHKLANWIDQFGTSGCVGCGRCIAWCPVGIDITEEVSAIRESPADPAVKIPTTITTEV